MKRSTYHASLFTLAVLCGCAGAQSDEPERRVVTGSVTFAGEPVEEGEIRFVPAAGTKAPASGAQISGGSYTVDNKGGVPLGTHRVEIRARRPKEGAQPIGEDVPGFDPSDVPREQYVPAKYNEQSELTITVESGSGPMTKDFELE